MKYLLAGVKGKFNIFFTAYYQSFSDYLVELKVLLAYTFKSKQSTSNKGIRQKNKVTFEWIPVYNEIECSVAADLELPAQNPSAEYQPV